VKEIPVITIIRTISIAIILTNFTYIVIHNISSLTRHTSHIIINCLNLIIVTYKLIILNFFKNLFTVLSFMWALLHVKSNYNL